MASEEEITRWLKETEADERLWYPRASTFANAILAIEQTALETRAQTLRRVLGMPPGRYYEGGPQ